MADYQLPFLGDARAIIGASAALGANAWRRC